MIGNSTLKKIIRDESLTASELCTLIFIYKVLGERECFETKLIEIAENISNISRSSVYQAIHSLEEKGYIRIKKKRGVYEIKRNDSVTKKGFTRLNYEVIYKALKDKEAASSPATLRFLLYILLCSLSGGGKPVKRITPVRSLSEELSVSRRTVIRVMTLLKRKGLLNVAERSGIYILSIPEKLVLVAVKFGRKVTESIPGDCFTVRRIMRKKGISEIRSYEADIGVLLMQYRYSFCRIGKSVEIAVEKAIDTIFREEREINPKVVHKILRESLNRAKVVASI